MILMTKFEYNENVWRTMRVELKVCLHKQWFLVSDATAASDTTQNIRIDPIFWAVSDAAVASNTENHVHVNTL
jgi:hypothetical protein